MLPGIEPGFEEYYIIKIFSDNHYTIAPYVDTLITRVMETEFLELNFITEPVTSMWCNVLSNQPGKNVAFIFENTSMLISSKFYRS